MESPKSQTSKSFFRGKKTLNIVLLNGATYIMKLSDRLAFNLFWAKDMKYSGWGK